MREIVATMYPKLGLARIARCDDYDQIKAVAIAIQ